MRSSVPRTVRDILPAAVPHVADRLLELGIRRQWPRAVGPEMARRAQPGRLVGGCLHVVVDNSPWLQEITLRSPEIIAALAGQFGAGTVRSLRVTLGQLETAPRTEPPRAPARPGVTEDDRRAIEALVEPIPDLDLRASIRRLLLKASRLR